VVIIGGGVIGCSIAYHLAKRGIPTQVIERDDIAMGSSGACDKAVLLQSKNPGIHLELALKSIEMFPELQKSLDTDIEFFNHGGMIAIQNEKQWQIMESFVERQRKSGLDVKLLDKSEARALQPALSEDIVGSTYSPMDCEANPIYLTLGLYRGAKKLGARFSLGTAAKNIKLEKGRVKSVETDSGEILCKYVVNAAGAYAPFVGRMVGLKIPIVPRRGQLIVTEPVAPLIRGEMNCARYITAKFNPELLGTDEMAKLGVGLSLNQTVNGNLLIGGTREFVGYNKNTTHKALKAILQHAASIVPALKNIHVIRSFSGLRPYTPDGLPILGEVPEVPGFIMAAGHEGDGIALSAVTGRIISDLIADGKPADDLNIDMSRLSLERFKEVDVNEFWQSHNCHGDAL